MRHHRAAVRRVPGVGVEGAVGVLRRHGFDEHDEVADEVVLAKPGTPWTLRAHQLPLKVTLAADDEGPAVRLALRYDSFVLFDQGDLEAEADRLCRALSRVAS